MEASSGRRSTEEIDIVAKKLYAVSVLALTVAVAPACATKKFVRTEVGNVNSKVDTLGGSLEETQERTRKNEERIGTVDTKAEAAGRSAQEARPRCRWRARSRRDRTDIGRACPSLSATLRSSAAARA